MLEHVKEKKRKFKKLKEGAEGVGEGGRKLARCNVKQKPRNSCECEKAKIFMKKKGTSVKLQICIVNVKSCKYCDVSL